MDQLFAKIFEIFSIEYIICVILTSYMIIKLIDYFNGIKEVPVWMKRGITFIVGGGYILFFREYTATTMQCLVSSFFVSLFIYDGAIKYLIKKFNIDYQK